MAFAIVGLRAPGLRIADPGCTAKTFPGYWDALPAPASRSSALTARLLAAWLESRPD